MNSVDLPNVVDRYDIDPQKVPVHVACVMDGNGRWAQQRGLPRNEGHAAGERALSDVVEGAKDLGIKWLTVYAFSTENWSRPAQEVEFLMGFNKDVLRKRAQELNEQNVRLMFSGRLQAPVPDDVLAEIDDAMGLTKTNTGLTLVIAFNYGGRAEIVDAIRSMISAGVDIDDIDEDLVSNHLFVPEMPDVDLMIRTSNEFRISNFLLWQVAYGELYFTETLWPDFTRNHFFEAVQAYQRRKRRFGGLDVENKSP